jgi:hypothetical protein
VACGFPRCSLNQSGSHALTGEECTEMHRGFLSQQHGLSFSVTSYEQRLSWQQSFEFGTNSCDCNRLKTNNLIIGLLPPRPLFLLRDPCAPHSCAFILLLLLPPPPLLLLLPHPYRGDKIINGNCAGLSGHSG